DIRGNIATQALQSIAAETVVGQIVVCDAIILNVSDVKSELNRMLALAPREAVHQVRSGRDAQGWPGAGCDVGRARSEEGRENRFRTGAGYSDARIAVVENVH